LSCWRKPFRRASKVKFRELFGRSELEKHIDRLQEAERSGQKENVAYFLFDRDRKPTNLQSTQKIRIRQWDRYCLENYLLDSAIIFDVLRREKYVKQPPPHIGEAEKLFREIAKTQLVARVMDEVYRSYGYPDPHLRVREVAGKTFQEAAQILLDRLETIRGKLAGLSEDDWKRAFAQSCQTLFEAQEQEWLRSWHIKCSGKQFFKDLYPRCGINVAPLTFKRQLLSQSKLTRAEGWKLLQAEFTELVGKNAA
jgi:hypothetical protein